MHGRAFHNLLSIVSVELEVALAPSMTLRK